MEAASKKDVQIPSYTEESEEEDEEAQVNTSMKANLITQSNQALNLSDEEDEDEEDDEEAEDDEEDNSDDNNAMSEEDD